MRKTAGVFLENLNYLHTGFCLVKSVNMTFNSFFRIVVKINDGVS